MVGPHLLSYFFLGAIVRNEFGACGDVDTVDVGIPYGRCGRGKEDFLRSGFFRHLHKLHGGGTSHNRIIHQQHILIFKLTLDRVQLQSYCLSSHFLTRHDEGACNVTIFYESCA